MTQGPKNPRRRNVCDWKAEAALLRVIAHPVRLRILDVLCERSCCVKDLNALFPGLPQPHLSHHMSALRQAAFVASCKDGPLRCYYILRPSLVLHLMELLRTSHPEEYQDKDKVQLAARKAKPTRTAKKKAKRKG